MISSVN